MAKPWTALPSWPKWPVRRIETLSQQEGFASKCVASMIFPDGTVSDTTAAVLPSPKRHADRRSEKSMQRVRFSGCVIRIYGGSTPGFMFERKWICSAKLVQAEFMSKAGTSIPSCAATVEASAGEATSGAELPEMTMPMSSTAIPARSRAMRAAAAAVWPLV